MYYLFRDIFLDSILDVFFLPSIFSFLGRHQRAHLNLLLAMSVPLLFACVCVCIYEENENKASQGKDARDN